MSAVIGGLEMSAEATTVRLGAVGLGAAGARAAATAAARTVGSSAAVVRLPSPPLPATPAEELGLPSPEFLDVPLSPCVLRERTDGSRMLLVSAPTLEVALGVEDADSAKQLLGGAAFVQVGTDSLLLRRVEALVVHGRAYLYRLFLREASAKVRG